MKSTKKRIIIVFALLTMALVLSCAFAACDKVEPDKEPSEGLEYSLNSDGKGYTVTGIGTCTDRELIIPSEYNAKPVTSIGEKAFRFCTGLTRVTIPDSVTRIGDSAFYDCTNLTSVTIGGSVTSIGGSAFEGCAGLTSVTIGNGVTSIGEWAFNGCTGLTSITIPDSVRSIGFYAFEGCNNLQDIYITDIAAWCNIAGLDNLMHNGASNKKLYIKNELATSITIPNEVKAIPSYAFCNCKGLTSITIPNSVTSIGNDAFYNTLWYNNQPDGLVYAGKVAYTYKGTMPSNTSIVLREGTLGIAGCAFNNYKGLTSVTIPNSVTSIGNDAFRNCKGLTSIKFNGTKAQWNAISKGFLWKYSVPAMQVDCTDGTISI